MRVCACDCAIIRRIYIRESAIVNRVVDDASRHRGPVSRNVILTRRENERVTFEATLKVNSGIALMDRTVTMVE